MVKELFFRPHVKMVSIHKLHACGTLFGDSYVFMPVWHLQIKLSSSFHTMTSENWYNRSRGHSVIIIITLDCN